MSNVKRALTDHLPGPVASGIRRARRIPRRVRYRLRQWRDPAGIDRARIVDALHEAGLRDGDAVFFQASLSAFGVIRGGPDTVIAALEDVVGPSGLIAMPAFSIRGKAVDELREGEPFDVRSSRSAAGAITERFRTRPGVQRSIHPTHSVAVLGPGATDLVAGHATAATPFGEGTPIARLVERNAMQVWFGCGVRPFTMYHAFECLREGGFPKPVFLPEPLAAVCIDADGVSHKVLTLVHDPQISSTRIDNTPRIADRMREELLKGGKTQSVSVGSGEILAVRLHPLFDELERLLQADITIY